MSPTHGTKYTFASYLDSAGRVVVDTDAPASVDVRADPPVRPCASAQAVGKAQIRRSTITDVVPSSRRHPLVLGWRRDHERGRHLLRPATRSGTRPGRVFSVTAGHCFANGANALVESGLRSYGTVSGRRLPTVTGHPMDMELLGGQSYAGRVYTGGVVSTTSRGVAAGGAASAGYSNYCHSGRTTGEHCGHTATSTERPGVHVERLQDSR